MLKREATGNGTMKVTFVLPNDGDDRDVYVAGDFNGWNPASTPLRRRGDVRTATVTLASGRTYGFRYFRDGEWFNDDAADDYEPNGYGGADGVIDLTDVDSRS